MADEFGDAPLIAVKDPRVCRFADYWLDLLEDDGFATRSVIILRNPVEVARSLETRDRLGVQRGLMLWLRHVLDAEFATRGRVRSFMTYASLLKDWRGVVDRLSNELGVAWPKRSIEIDRTIDDFLDERLRRAKAGEDEVLASGAVSDWVKQAYSALLELCEGGKAKPATLVRLDKVRSDFDQACTMFGPLVANTMRRERDALDMANASNKKIQAATAEANEQKATVAERSAEIEALKSDISTLKAVLETGTEERAHEAEVIALLKRQLHQVVTQSGVMGDRLNSMRTELEAARAEAGKVSAVSAERTALVAQVGELKAQLQTARDDHAAPRAEVDALQQRIEDLLVIESEEARSHSDAEGELRSTLIDLQEQLVVAEARLREGDAEAAARIESLEAELSELREEREALLEARKETWDSTDSELRAELARLEDERAHQQVQARRDLDGVTAQLKQARADAEMAWASVAEMEENYRKLVASHDAAPAAEASRALAKRLKAEQATIRDELVALRDELARADERERQLHRRLFEQSQKAAASGLVAEGAHGQAALLTMVAKEREFWECEAKSAQGRERSLQLRVNSVEAQLARQADSLEQGRNRLNEAKVSIIRALENALLSNGAKPVSPAERARIAGPLFDESFYRRQIDRLGLQLPHDAIDHFIRVGSVAGLQPHPLFDVEWYLAKNPDVRASGLNPLHHFLSMGDKEGRSPHPLFDAKYYAHQNVDVRKAGVVSLVHYVRDGWREGRNPNPWFYSAWYLEEHPDVEAASICPLTHYVMAGEKEGRRPHPSFSPDWYAATHLGEFERLSPLAHFLDTGRPEKLPTQRPEVAHDAGRQTILFVAHTAGRKLFGSERSFLDVLAAVDRSKYRVIVALPNPHRNYVDAVAPLADQIHFVREAWWRNGLGDRPEVIDRFRELIRAEGVDLVYVNTIVLKEPMLAARAENVPAVCHVREAIADDPDLQAFIGHDAKQIIEDVKARSDYLVVNSRATAKTFGGDRSFQIYNAVDTDRFKMAPPVVGRGPLIAGMVSSNIKKKGVEDVVTLARACKNDGLNVRFSLIGPHTDETRRLEKELKSWGGEDMVEFPGYADDPAKAVEGFHVMLNFSHFAESFGRTAAEAAAAGRPSIVYRHGALPEVVDHGVTGYVIDYLKPLEALPILRRLLDDPALLRKLGEAGRRRAIECFSHTALTRDLNEVLVNALDGKAPAKDGKAVTAANPVIETATASVSEPASAATDRLPPVTVVVPNYNYEHYMGERLGSILNQTVRPTEIIFLDDNSTDNSVEVARRILEASDIPFRIIANKANKGVYRQWLAGFDMAKSDWVWIAEADDRCEPDFLASLLPLARDGVNIVYAQSRKIDEHGETVAQDNRAHTNDISTERWNQDYVQLGTREVADALVYRNTIPNASAALLRKSAVAGIEDQLVTMRFTGDWMLYAHMLRQGKIAFVSRSLNHFRRHQGSVTRKEGRSLDYLRELARIRGYFVDNFPVLPRQLERLDWFLDRDYKTDGVEKNSKCPEVSDLLGGAASRIADRKRFGIITTNNGSHYGGSEMLWRETAMMLRTQGHDVQVVIKNWQPRPDFFDDFERAGIKLLFKEEDGFGQLKAAKPDLTLVSIGDQDEGIEYYPELKAAGLEYVIINQLTKEARFWPVRAHKTDQVKAGYEGARCAFFTCQNNRRVMEDRLATKLPNADVHFNPYHINRQIVPRWPAADAGYQIAIPSKLLFIHKGQDLLVDIAASETWKKRNAVFNFYGIGPDEQNLKDLAEKAGITSFRFHGRVPDIGVIWRDNHALLMPSRMEGLPIMLISAMISARVPIVTDIGGHAEVVRDNISGYIAPNPDRAEIAEALERAWTQRESWQEIGKAARKDVLAFLPEHPVAHFVGQLNALFNEKALRAAS
ncbi:glycosyltransferase [Maricaulis sp.]|uniref:glycosyltransferase n=1 Tax=Maricaulis sp. TaxID=1486257 RepID=UPI0025BD1F2E|nr:glycosyltransferase [Maricaulis sp.]